MISKFMILVIVVCMTLAWLSPFHFNPWRTFSSETLTFISLLSLIIFFRNKDIKLPVISIIIILISFIPIIQFFFNIIFFFETALLSFVYIFACGLAFLYGFNLNEVNKKKFKIILFGTILFSSIITSIFALTQFLGLEKNIWYIFPMGVGYRIYGNFAQPNNMATFLVMGFISLTFLYLIKKINIIFFVIFGLVLMTSIFFSYSRIGWIELILFIFVTLIYSLIKYKEFSLIKVYVFFLVFFISLFLFDKEIVYFLNGYNLGLNLNESGLTRLTYVGGRSIMWPQMLYAIKESPFWGYGWDQTIVAQLLVSEYIYHNEQTRSAHNIFMDIFIWNGLFLGFLISSLILFIYFKSIFYSQGNFFIKMLVIVFSLHAMVEFPQNYAHFLILIFLCLGFLYFNSNNVIIFRVNNYFNLFLILIFSLFFSLIVRDYLNYKYILMNYDKSDYENGEGVEEIIYLDRLDALLKWVFIDKKNIESKKQIDDFDKFVITAPTKYNLISMYNIYLRKYDYINSKKYCIYLNNLYKEDINCDDHKEIKY